MAFALILAGAFVVAAVLAAVVHRARVVGALGLVPAAGFVVWAYLGATTDRQRCSDCVHVLGRWWQPSVATFLALCGYVAWLAGTGVGVRRR
jgi:hypothetical protein